MSRGELCLALPPELDHLARAARELRSFLDRQGVDQRVAYRAEVILEELVTNIIKYGLESHYPGEEPKVSVRCRMELSQLVLVVEDPGPPFDPAAHADACPDPGTPDLKLDPNLAAIKPGGLGLRMVRSLCARLAYERRGGSNLTRAFLSLEE